MLKQFLEWTLPYDKYIATILLIVWVIIRFKLRYNQLKTDIKEEHEVIKETKNKESTRTNTNKAKAGK